MGEAKRRGEVLLRTEIVNFDGYPERLEKLIDQGKVTGVLSIHRITTDVSGLTRLGMFAGGMATVEAFDLICIMRRSLMETAGLKDTTDAVPVEYEDEGDPPEGGVSYRTGD